MTPWAVCFDCWSAPSSGTKLHSPSETLSEPEQLDTLRTWVDNALKSCPDRQLKVALAPVFLL
jgi:hypothetical protein